MMNRYRLLVLATLVLSTCSGRVAAQLLPNGSFENGLNNWTTGFQGQVESLTAGAFTGNPPAVPDGTRVALLSSGPGNVGGGALNIDGNGINEDDTTTLDTTLIFNFAPAVLRFEWAFATSEENSAGTFDDVFGLLLNNQFVFTGSVNKPGGVSPFPDAPPSLPPGVVVNSPGVTNNSNFSDGISPFSSACVDIPGASNGNNSIPLRFFIADQGDALFDSGLLLDDVQLDRSCLPPGEVFLQQLTTTVKELPLEVKNGALVQRFIANGQAAAASDGSVVAFISNADLTGDNPSHIQQVYSFAGGAFQRELAFTNSCEPPDPCATVQDLDISRNGRWIAVAARATDGDNLEIYRIDRNTSTVLQITSTSGCDNTAPSINNNGSGIAFLSNCPDFLTQGGGNMKMVLWNNGSFINSAAASTCRDYAPAVNGNNNRRFTAFASNCNHGGLNAANTMRVFRFDRNTGNFALVDNPVAGLSDVVDINRNGNLIVYVADDGGMQSAFRRNMGQMQAELMGASDPLAPVIGVRIIDENDGDDLALERLDVLTGASVLWHVDATTQVSTSVAVGSFDGGFSISRSGAVRWIHFASGEDPVGQNGAPDENIELFQARIEP